MLTCIGIYSDTNPNYVAVRLIKWICLDNDRLN
jgi:hypothetical protein